VAMPGRTPVQVLFPPNKTKGFQDLGRDRPPPESQTRHLPPWCWPAVRYASRNHESTLALQRIPF